MWAEWYRHLAERGVPPLHQLPRDVWRFTVPILRVADLSDQQRLTELDLPPLAPGRKTWPPYQRLGETLWQEGWDGILAPSAARPAGRVLCLFVNNAATLPATPIAPPATVSEPPAPPIGMRT